MTTDGKWFRVGPLTTRLLRPVILFVGGEHLARRLGIHRDQRFVIYFRPRLNEAEALAGYWRSQGRKVKIITLDDTLQPEVTRLDLEMWLRYGRSPVREEETQ